jgi:hypothetical protein
MKISLKVKVIYHAFISVAVLVWALIDLLQGEPIQKTIYICIASLTVINLSLWLAFKSKDSARNESGL